MPWDEAFDGGRARAAWSPLLAHLGDPGSEFAQRWEQGQRLLREHGATFHQFADGGEDARPWSLDPVPMVVAPEEWDGLERGVAQRAAACAALIADCYGPQRLVRDGLVPTGVLAANPSYLRPARDIAPAGGSWLTLYACEVVRGADGRWVVAADLTQVPSGAGFAVDNRLVLARVLPEPFHDLRVQRVAGFFRHLRRTLAALAPQGRDNPRVVLLTPGPSSETFFEHAFLARYLGYTLVQGDDLTVRDERVLLKTLGGLHPVDVILRRLGDEWCDPLELRNDSLLGTLGLCAAARAGGVAIANPLGSAVGEAPAWMPYLPAACRHLLGEEPRLASQPTWWGGAHPKALEDPSLLVRPAFHYRARPGAPDAAGVDERRIRPHAFVAQRPFERSLAPCWEGGRLVQRGVSMRLFAVRAVDGGWQVLPGGLARVASDGDPGAVWSERGGIAKDVWVRSRGPVEEVTLLRGEGAPLELRRGGIDLPSRIADGLFWLGRYAERLEDGARLVRAALVHHLDEGAGLKTWRPLLAAMGMVLDEHATGEAPLVAAAATLSRVHGDLRRNAAAVRDRLSDDTWRAILWLGENAAAPEDERADACLARLDRLVLAASALAGMGSENTTRGPGWMFLDLGRRIERAAATCELVQAAAAIRLTRESLQALLRAADSTITYRSRYLATIQAAPVIDLLLTDATNPRSAAFQAERIEQLVAQLPAEVERAMPAPAERLAIAIRSRLRLADPHALAGDGAALDAFLAALVDDLNALSESLATAYLTHVAPIRNLAHDGGGA